MSEARMIPSRRRGVALLEFALVVPVLLAILLGIIEFTIYGQNNLRLSNAAYEGARAAARGLNLEAIRNRVQSAAAPLSLQPQQGGRLVVERARRIGTAYGAYAPLADSSVEPGRNAAEPDDLVRVTATARNRPLVGLLSFMFARNLTASVVMRRER